MTVTSALYAVLNADATLLATLTGGVYTEDIVGRNGISPEQAPGAYDANGFMKPNASVQQRTQFPWGGGHDPNEQWDTQRAVVEIYLRSDGAGVYDPLVTAADRIARDLHEKVIAGAGAVKEIYRLIDRDAPLENALLIRVDYQVVFGRQL